MSEQEMIGWVVMAIVVLAGLFFTIYVPMEKNVKAMTKLTCSVDSLNDKLADFENKNDSSHKRLWEEADKQNILLEIHEKRLHEMDGKWSEDFSK